MLLSWRCKLEIYCILYTCLKTFCMHCPGHSLWSTICRVVWIHEWWQDLAWLKTLNTLDSFYFAFKHFSIQTTNGGSPCFVHRHNTYKNLYPNPCGGVRGVSLTKCSGPSRKRCSNSLFVQHNSVLLPPRSILFIGRKWQQWRCRAKTGRQVI